jgi:hypothetical protein
MGGPGAFLEKLVTLKVEHSVVDVQVVRYLSARSPLKNLSLRGSGTGNANLDDTVVLRWFRPQVTNTWQSLKLLDLSEMMNGGVQLLKQWVLDNAECQITHLYLEKYHVIPRRVMPAHLKLEFLSVAGYQAWGVDGVGETSTFLDIESWAAIPSMREMNVSGCNLNEVQRQSLVATRPNVVFDLSEDFRESPRLYF